MSTSKKTIDYITDQLSGVVGIRTRPMFGEYALYCDERVVGLVCDDQLFLKPTAAGKTLLMNPVEVPPYPGAKMYYLLDDEILEDREMLAKLIRVTADALPMKSVARKAKKP